MRVIAQAAIGLLGVVLGGGGSAAAGTSVTLELDGPQDAIVAYACDFTEGGHAEGRVTPPWSNTWAAEGAHCRFEHIVGRREVSVHLRARGSRARVSTSGRGSTVSLSIGRLPANGS